LNPPNAAKLPYRVFFSHGGEDTYVVNQFLRPKVEGSGAVVFVDAGEIKYGDDFRQIVLRELTRCDEFLVLLTRSSIRRAWVFAELGASLIRGIRVVVVRYGVSEEDLRADGVLSLLGTTNLLVLDNFDEYVGQLRLRVESVRDG
jgi:hypothetical protein